MERLESLPINRLANAVKEDRLTLGMTQKQYAKRLGISERTLRRIEHARPEALKKPYITEQNNSIRYFSKATQRKLAKKGFKEEIQEDTNVLLLNEGDVFGNKIKLLQKALGYSNKKLAKELKIKPEELRRWKLGKLKTPSRIKNKKALKKLESKGRKVTDLSYQIIYRNRITKEVHATIKRDYDAISELITKLMYEYDKLFQILRIRRVKLKR